MTTRPAVQSDKKPLRKVIARRTILGIAILLLILIPSVVLFALTGQPAATYAGMGTLVGAVAVMAGGFRIGVITSIVLGLLAPLAVVAGLSPATGAALMALMTLMIGRMSRFGLHSSVLLVPIMVAWPMLTPIPWLPREALAKINDLLAHKGLTLAQAIDKLSSGGASSSSGGSSAVVDKVMAHAMKDLRMDTGYLLWIAAFFFIGAIIPVLILPLVMRKATRPQPVAHNRREAMGYTITITVLTAASTYYLLDHPKMIGGSFLIASILMLTQVSGDVKWKLTLERVLGTLGGVVLMFLLALVMGSTTYTEVMGVPMPLGLYGIGLLFAVFAVIAKFSPRQWIYFVLMAPAAACLNAFGIAGAGSLNEQRLVDNVVGAGLVVAAALITLVAGRFGNRRNGTSAPEPV